jgi:uncharacterized protein (DUF2384 family)
VITSWDCTQIFDMYGQLLELYEPHAARAWLITPQPLLDGRRPCELLSTPRGHQRLLDLLAKLRDDAHL